MKIGIIGAGATGLAAGYELVKKGHEVTLFEAEKEVGGLSGVMQVGGQKLEKYYHHLFTSDDNMIDLINELGLGQNLIWRHAMSGTYINDYLYPYSAPIDLILFKEIPFIERIMTGVLILRARWISDWQYLEKLSAKDWIIKNIGRRTYERYWESLLVSKFGSDADSVSAAWLWNKLKLRGSTRGKNLNKEMFGYLKGSFGLLYDTLTEKIKEKGGSINSLCKVTGLSEGIGKTVDITTEAGVFNFHKVITTVSPTALLKFCRGFPKEYAQQLGRIKYKSVICAILEMDRPLSQYYWITVSDNKSPFVAVIEHKNLLNESEYGNHIVYLSKYLDENEELYKANDETVKVAFIDYLCKIFNNFEKTSVKACKINRATYAQPVVVTGYSKLLPDFRTPLPGLYMANMAQIYPEDRGQNYAIKMGKQIAEMVETDIELISY